MYKTLCVICFLYLTANALAQDASSRLSFTYETEFPSIPIREQRLSVVVSIIAPSSVERINRTPLSLSCVLDRSGSMSGQKISLLRQSTNFLVNRLQVGDYLGVVSYSSSARVDFALTSLSNSNRGGFTEAINSITASGSTNLAAGLFRGIDQQVDADIPGTLVKSVILFTDGLANQGVTSINSIVNIMASRLSGTRPPTVYALGFGGDHDASFLQAIAEAGSGAYVFVSDANAIASTIGEIFGGLLTTTAQDIRVTLTPLNGARIVNVRGGSVRNDLRQTTFPDLFAEERRDILIDLRIPVLNDALQRQEVLQVRLQYFNTVTERQVSENVVIAVQRTVDVVTVRSAPLVETTRLRYRVADDIVLALSQREQGNREAATATLDGTLTALSRSSEAESSEVQALTRDVERTRSEVSTEGTLARSASNRLTAGANSLTTQRAAGTQGTQFASVSATRRQRAEGRAAAAFVSTPR
eukprot:g4277.t1